MYKFHVISGHSQTSFIFLNIVFTYLIKMETEKLENKEKIENFQFKSWELRGLSEKPQNFPPKSWIKIEKPSPPKNRRS